jgi:hypothetical protein
MAALGLASLLRWGQSNELNIVFNCRWNCVVGRFEAKFTSSIVVHNMNASSEHLPKLLDWS